MSSLSAVHVARQNVCLGHVTSEMGPGHVAGHQHCFSQGGEVLLPGPSSFQSVLPSSAPAQGEAGVACNRSESVGARQDAPDGIFCLRSADMRIVPSSRVLGEKGSGAVASVC